MTLSLSKVLWAIILSFVLASAASVFFSYRLMPDEAQRPARRSEIVPLDFSRSALSEQGRRAILERNIFNSDGELGDGDSRPTSNVPTGALVKSDLPLALRGVIFAGDPFNGLAMIENTQRRRVGSYTIGDIIVNDARLVEVYDHRVILERNGNREYIERDRFELVTARSRAGGGRATPTGPRAVTTGPPPDTYREDGFERDGADIRLTEEFKRSMLSPDNFNQILQDAKAEPNMVNGAVEGFRLTRIREGSIYEKAGFQNGDVIEEINGIPLRGADGAIRLLQQLRNAAEIEVRIKRGDNSFNSNIVIQ